MAWLAGETKFSGHCFQPCRPFYLQNKENEIRLADIFVFAI